ncbi:acylneuraminate cytidylyltransferase family protein [bacterium]|nr:acylneuraminate cytidylyltransferase family protein [bacterium]
MKTYAFIFARGGSKGVPRKNIRELNNKPLIEYSIEVAKEIDEISSIFVSTDDVEIANIAKKLGVEVIPRPKGLAQDNSPEWLAWKHAVQWVYKSKGQFDKFVSLPTTSPLRNDKDVKGAINLLKDETDIVITITDTTRSPFFNMVKVDNDNYAKLLVESDNIFTRRQDAPKAFDMTTVAYVSSPEFILRNNNLFDGRVKAYKVPNERAIDIDTELDFSIAEFLIKEGKNA